MGPVRLIEFLLYVEEFVPFISVYFTQVCNDACTLLKATVVFIMSAVSKTGYGTQQMICLVLISLSILCLWYLKIWSECFYSLVCVFEYSAQCLCVFLYARLFG